MTTNLNQHKGIPHSLVLMFSSSCQGLYLHAIQKDILAINHLWKEYGKQIQMEGIVTNLFKILERSISNWFQFFTFSFKPLFANVKANFISNLEIVINTMLVMFCLVLGLALFQLFLYHLMHQLNLFNELLCSINVILTINSNIFPKDKI
jgi:hypothetical protein